LRKQHYTTEEALSLLQQGKEAGLDHYFHAHYGSLSYFAFTLTQDNHLAEELAAEAFVKLWQNREAMQETGSVKAWLYRTVRNGAIDHLRKVKRMRINEQGLQTADTMEQSILHKLVHTETLRQILHLMEILPPQCRKVFQLFFLHGKSYSEIAREMNISPITAKNQKNKAVRLLREKAGPLLQLTLLAITYQLL
jgi:RNA polymerase sigma-70 factor (family 1)